ncbi:hypothetical protein BD289DRAFT_379885 [Coniella lustricola]|uniref:Uncharacterized protein n=1 Tax=Coniella lustricola TaxID=2025994 RepID=A0A2T2ZS25_9PEZI|nr:hypothetical protein BD289DRAFT_379885 [Coniella lustricola]
MSPFDLVQVVPRAQIYEERLRRFSQRCNLPPNTELNYPTEGHVLRVNKQPRMRVHRLCHQCGNEVNTRGLCGKCNHSFCPECTRYPRKQNEVPRTTNREARNSIVESGSAEVNTMPDCNAVSIPTTVLRLPQRQTKQELVFRKVRQRVRRTCCQCQDERGDEIVFCANQRCCPKCSHVRCTDCPRDPAKRDRYPYGYPGDVFGAKSIPHHKCHECHSIFPPNVENGTSCASCSHRKCDACPRLMPQKVELEFDPEVVKSVQQKLANLGSSTSIHPAE